jgi:polyisoprenoid-binding protein YceI
MKRIFLISLPLFLQLSGNILYAQVYTPVDNRSSIKVTIKNAGMEVEGKLSGLEGNIHFNPADLKNASFSMSVDASTIHTGIDVRDEALQTHEYLDAKKFPKISFVSKQFIQTKDPNIYSVKGTLTIKGISNEITFPFTAVPKNEGMLFTGEFKVNRLNYKIGVGSVVLSDNMVISLVVFAKKE